MNNERRYIAISIKHSEWSQKRFKTKKYQLWGNRTKDDDKRSFSGYTFDVEKCEVYSLEDWKNSVHYKASCMKLDEPVKVTFDLCKKYAKYDTVLVDIDDYMKYLEYVDDDHILD